MEHPPKTKPGVGSTDLSNLEDMSIHELVSLLRTAFLTEDFDRVEEVLVSRDKKIQTEILHLQEMVERERLTKIQAEEDLRKREELLCERGKLAQSYYEKLLKDVKKNISLADREIVGELRKKNSDLELEVCELRKLKEKWVDDSNALAELRIKVDVLESDNNALRLKYSELEKSMEKNSEALSDDVVTDSEYSDEESEGDYEPPSKTSMSDNLTVIVTSKKLEEKSDFLSNKLKICVANKDKALQMLEANKKIFKECYDEYVMIYCYPYKLKKNVPFSRFQEALTAIENALSEATKAFNKAHGVLKEKEYALWAAACFLMASQRPPKTSRLVEYLEMRLKEVVDAACIN